MARNLAIEYRYAEGKAERLTPLALELVRSKVDLLVGFPASESSSSGR
jgi:hypothetical protein